MELNRYGGKYWCVILNDGKEIHFYADTLEIDTSGALISRRVATETHPSYSFISFAAGAWKLFYGANIMTGDPVCVEHWNVPERETFKAGRPKDKISPTIRAQVFKRDNYTCKVCGKKSEDGAHLVIDHVVPRAKGGTNSIRNLQTLCDPCNAGKAGK
jgi:hypothetical protein